MSPLQRVQQLHIKKPVLSRLKKTNEATDVILCFATRIYLKINKY